MIFTSYSLISEHRALTIKAGKKKMASLQIRYPPSRPLAPNPSFRNFTTRFKCFKPLEASPNSDLPLDGEDNPDMSDPVKLAFSRAEAYRQQKLQAQGQKLEANLSGKGGKSSVVDNPFSGTGHSISRYSAISSNCSGGLTSNTFWLVQIGVLKHGAEPNPFTMSTNFFLKFATCYLVIEIWCMLNTGMKLLGTR